ncbi:MAG: hypothetical protein KAI17_14820 [Thiotrichaceae bacterium]|nr:hypothetical protein [Thiotrichaceae bacterium]
MSFMDVKKLPVLNIKYRMSLVGNWKELHAIAMKQPLRQYEIYARIKKKPAKYVLIMKNLVKHPTDRPQ